MQFDSSYITTAGSELFARATASTSSNESSPIIWGTVYTSSTDMREYTSDQMRALSDIQESDRSSSGSVISATHDLIDSEHVTKLECEVRNDSYSGYAYAIGVYAKLQGDDNEVLAVIARVDTDESTPDVIPSSGDYRAAIDFILTIRDNQLSTIEAPASYYASAQSLQDLMNRTVTTHVESSSTTGEDQDIYGNKTFKNTVACDNEIKSNTILPIDDNGSIGTSDNKWSIIYADTLSGVADSAVCDSDGNTISSYYCTLSTNQAISGNKTFNSSVYIPTNATHNLYITGYSDGSGIRFGDTSTSTSYSMIVGESHTNVSCDIRQNYYINNVLTGTVQTNCDSSGNIITTTRIGRAGSITSNKWSLGASNSKLKSVYATTFYGSLSGNADTATSATSATTATNATNASIIKHNGYEIAKGYYSSATTRYFAPPINATGAANSGVDLGTSSYKWRTLFIYQLGNSSYHIANAYIDNLYIGSTALSSYIANTTVTNANSLSYSNVKKLSAYANLVAYADIVPNGLNLYSLGTSAYRWKNAYVDNLYIGSDAVNLSNYIDERVSSTIYSTTGAYAPDLSGYPGIGGLFIVSQITIKYGFVGTNDNWYSSRDDLRICRGDAIRCTTSDTQFSQIPNTAGILIVRIQALSLPYNSRYLVGTYKILNDLRWTDNSSQPATSSTSRSYTFTGTILCQRVG